MKRALAVISAVVLAPSYCDVVSRGNISGSFSAKLSAQQNKEFHGALQFPPKELLVLAHRPLRKDHDVVPADVAGSTPSKQSMMSRAREGGRRQNLKQELHGRPAVHHRAMELDADGTAHNLDSLFTVAKQAPEDPDGAAPAAAPAAEDASADPPAPVADSATAPDPNADPAAPDPNADPNATASPDGGDSDTASSSSKPTGPSLSWRFTELLGFGFSIAVLYALIWYAMLPSEERPEQLDDAFVKWLETQEEVDEENPDAINCVLIRIQTVDVKAEQAYISVNCDSFGDQTFLGDTDQLPLDELRASFAAPLVNPSGEAATMGNAKPKVQFEAHEQNDDGEKKLGSGSFSPERATNGEGWTDASVSLSASAIGLSSDGKVQVQSKVLNVSAAALGTLRASMCSSALKKELKKPWTFAARLLTTALMAMLIKVSVPFYGYMFSGCFYLSTHGLSTAGSLCAMSVPHWLDLFGIDVPSWLQSMSLTDLKIMAGVLASAGGSGISMCLFWNRGSPCAQEFWMLEWLLLVGGALYATAWYRGEGTGWFGW